MSNTETPQQIYYIVILSVFMIIGIMARLFFIRYNIPVPYKSVVLILCIAAGTLLAKVPHLRNSWLALHMSPQSAVTAYVPVYTMSIMYCMDNHLFSKYLLQATIVSLSTALFTPFIISAILTRVLYSNWTYLAGLLVSVVVLPLEPRHIIDMFQVLSNYKFLATMYEIESCLIVTPMTLFITLVDGYNDGILTTWYHFVNVILRQLVGAFLIGLMAGFLQLRLMIMLFCEPMYAVCVSILVLYGSYLFGKQYGVCAPFVSFTTCGYLIINKHRLSVDVDKALQCFWATFCNLVDTPLLMFAMTELSMYAVLLFEYKTMYAAIFLYCFGLMDRLRATLMVWPLLNCLPYKVNAKCLIVLGWAGVRGTLNMYVILSMVAMQNIDSYLLSTVCYVLLSNIINCTTMPVLLDILGLRSVASTRLANMYTCLSQLREKQLNVLEILKANRYLSNANWELVRKQSILDAPYVEAAVKFHKTMQFNEEHLSKWEERVLVCPDCHKVFRDEITQEEMFDRRKTSSLKILKIQRMSLIKQHENGYITTDILQLLLHHLDTRFVNNQRQKDSRITLEEIKQTNRCLLAFSKCLHFLAHDIKYPAPDNNFKQMCYYIVLHIAYEVCLYLIILGNAVFSLWNNDQCCRNWMYWYHVSIWVSLSIDVLLNTVAFSSKTKFACKSIYMLIWTHRWETYHRIILMIGLVDIFTTNESNVFDWLIYYIPSFRTLSALLLVRIIQHFLGTETPKLIRRINLKIYRTRVLRWTVASAWIVSIDEVLQSLSQLIAERAVRNSYDVELREERKRLMDEISGAHKYFPCIAITVKTKQVVRITLMTMDVAMKAMQKAGYTDAIECAAINKVLSEAHNFHRSITFIQPNPLRSFFQNIAWMPHENVDVMERFYSSTTLVSKDTNDLIMTNGSVAEGVFVVVTGVLIEKYTPSINYLQLHRGKFPIVDYLSNTSYGLPFDHVIVSGGTVGELSVITDRPFNCNIIAGSPCQGYWIPAEVILEASELCKNQLFGLEARIWLHSCHNLAVAIFMQETVKTKDDIEDILSRSVIPNLQEYETFFLPEFLDDLLLIHGTVTDQNGHVYFAPCLIPASAEQLKLLHDDYLAVRLLMVPRVNVSPTLIMDYQIDQKTIATQQASDTANYDRTRRQTFQR